MKYKYFISYFVTTNNNGFGFGSYEVTLEEKIDCINDIKYLEEEFLKDYDGCKKLTIINYQLMKKIKKEVEQMNEFNRNWLNLALEYKDNPDVTFDLSQNDVRILLTYIEVLQSKIDKAVEYIDLKSNVNGYDKNKLLDILKEDKIQEIPQFKGTMEQLDELCEVKK